MKRVLVLVLALAACSAHEPRALTSGEAERLALVRFSNYSAGVKAFTASVPSSGGKLMLDGKVDFVNHLGRAEMRTEGRSDDLSRGPLQWDLRRLWFAGQERDLQEQGSELDGALRLLVNLGADRPENALLLQQSTARWVRADKVGESTVDVLEGPADKGPSRLRYWVDGNGKLRRLEAKLGNQQEFAVFDFT